MAPGAPGFFQRLREAASAAGRRVLQPFEFLRTEVGRRVSTFFAREEYVVPKAPGATVSWEIVDYAIAEFRKLYRTVRLFKQVMRVSEPIYGDPGGVFVGPGEQLTFTAYILTPEGVFFPVRKGFKTGEQYSPDRLARILASAYRERVPDVPGDISDLIMAMVYKIDWFLTRHEPIPSGARPLME